MKFIARRPELLKIEGKYEDIFLSCRHKDILRCGSTRHFTSCFRPNGGEQIQPKIYCFHPDIAIVYKPDTSGQFVARVFVRFQIMREDGRAALIASKLYGNGLSIEDLKSKLGRVATIFCSDQDLYLTLPGERW